jgi:succinyl-CoA synthetase alpha subunit
MEAFFDPGSVAVLGASNDPSKWGFWLSAGALTGAHRRRVHLINSRAASIQGRPTFAHLSELPEIPELLVISIPGPAVPAAVDEALAAGVRAFLIISARVPNAEDLAARIIAAGARLIGPNSLGLVDSAHELLLAWGHFTPGSLAVVTQSGQLGTEIATLSARSGLGISRFASIGGQSDVRAAEILDSLVDDPDTAQVVIYLESFTGGHALVQAMQALRAAGKPTMILTTGSSTAGCSAGEVPHRVADLGDRHRRRCLPRRRSHSTLDARRGRRTRRVLRLLLASGRPTDRHRLRLRRSGRHRRGHGRGLRPVRRDPRPGHRREGGRPPARVRRRRQSARSRRSGGEGPVRVLEPRRRAVGR